MATDYISRDIAISELIPIYKSASFRNRNVFATARKCLETIENAPVADAVELNRDKLIELLGRYFTIGNSYTYELTRVKEAFEIGTMTFDDFVEWDEGNVADLADWLIKELKEGNDG